jgi:hypothetical protein
MMNDFLYTSRGYWIESLRVLVVVLAGQSFLESRLNGVENVVLAVGEISQKLCEQKKVSEGGKTRGVCLASFNES